MPIHYINTAIDTVSDVPYAPVGQQCYRLDPVYGEQVWMYVLNAEGASAFAEGHVIAREATEPLPGIGILAPTGSPTVRLLGVAQHAIPAGSYGWILRSGAGALVLAATGGVAANIALVVDDAVAGEADDAAATTGASFGFAHAAISAGETGRCTVFCTG